MKDELHNTPHPDRGAVTVSLTGLAADGAYVLDIDGQTADITGSSFTFHDLLTPGTYSLVVYNRAEGFTFDGRMAQVHTEDGKTRADGASIIPLPGYLKTARRLQSRQTIRCISLRHRSNGCATCISSSP